MARRLSFSGYDGSKPVALRGVPAPLRVGGRAHSLVQVLEIALAHLGLKPGYDAIMGLCGLAFRTPPWPETPAPTISESADALARLSGALGDCLSVISGERTASSEQVLDMVAASVDDGRPCLAFGWGSDKDHWSIIAGYDRGKGRLLGHCVLDEPRRQYESWPPKLEALAVMTAEPDPQGPGAVIDALQAGGRRWADEGATRYDGWIEEMRLLKEPPGVAHEQAVELLADARAGAAGFAEQVASREAEIPAAWLTRAVEQWREVVRLLEARGVPHSPEALMALETEDGRGDWAALLEFAVSAEEKAAACVRLSATADYPPEEAPAW
ncbi:MAG: hypothetical protein ACLFU7_13435 [Armatimonadota bacterium]